MLALSFSRGLGTISFVKAFNETLLLYLATFFRFFDSPKKINNAFYCASVARGIEIPKFDDAKNANIRFVVACSLGIVDAVSHNMVMERVLMMC